MEGSNKILRVKSWEELLARPNHLPEFEFKDNENDRLKLKDIIWPYSFDSKGKCALTCCRTSHSNGYIISLDDGRETHIGRDCGIKYFGDEFLKKINIRNIQVRYYENFEKIQEFHKNIDHYKKIFNDFVYSESRISIYKIRLGIRELVNGNEKIGNFIKNDFRANINFSGEIIMNVQKTQDELELEKARTGKNEKIKQTNNVKLAQIYGFDIITRLNQINNLISYFENLFKIFKPDTNTPAKEILTTSKIISDFQKRVRELKELSDQGNIFFEKSNLSKMTLAIRKDYHQLDFLMWIDKFLST